MIIYYSNFILHHFYIHVKLLTASSSVVSASLKGKIKYPMLIQFYDNVLSMTNRWPEMGFVQILVCSDNRKTGDDWGSYFNQIGEVLIFFKCLLMSLFIYYLFSWSLSPSLPGADLFFAPLTPVLTGSCSVCDVPARESPFASKNQRTKSTHCTIHKLI